MARHITASGAVTVAPGCNRLLIQNNGALTGTITVQSNSVTIAVITNPAVGNQFEYWKLQDPVTVNPSATCDITVGVDGSRG